MTDAIRHQVEDVASHETVPATTTDLRSCVRLDAARQDDQPPPLSIDRMLAAIQHPTTPPDHRAYYAEQLHICIDNLLDLHDERLVLTIG